MVNVRLLTFVLLRPKKKHAGVWFFGPLHVFFWDKPAQPGPACFFLGQACTTGPLQVFFWDKSAGPTPACFFLGQACTRPLHVFFWDKDHAACFFLGQGKVSHLTPLKIPLMLERYENNVFNQKFCEFS